MRWSSIPEKTAPLIHIEECPIYIALQKGESVHRNDEVYWKKHGTSFPVEYWSHPVVGEGKTLGAVIIFIDITERKQASRLGRRWKAHRQKHAKGGILDSFISAE
jgi:PAS domain-containing protein